MAIIHPDYSMWQDWIRLITIALGFFMDGVIIAIILVAHKFRAPPKYVYFISAAYILLEGGVQHRVYDSVNDPHVHPPLVLGLVANLFGVIAFILMWEWYLPKNRKKRYAAEAERVIKLYKESQEYDDQRNETT